VGEVNLDPIVVRGITPKLRRAFNHALGLANESGHRYVGMEHMLLGLLVEKESSVRCMLAELGLDPNRVEFILNNFYDRELRHIETHTRPLAKAVVDTVRRDVGQEVNNGL
jgi:ATP-dependent Clp protease ATP-binding subunit ClpA